MNITKENFGSTQEGREVTKYTLGNTKGMEVEVINFGAIITSIRVPDKHNEPGDVVLGFDTLEEYTGDHPFFGASETSDDQNPSITQSPITNRSTESSRQSHQSPSATPSVGSALSITAGTEHSITNCNSRFS